MQLDSDQNNAFVREGGVLTVTDFTRRVKSLLEGAFPEIWIRGEISNFRRQSSGHCYFALKDGGSQVSAVLFRGDSHRVGVDLSDGLQVIVFGRVSLYEPRGNYQIIVRFAVEDGLGRLQLQFERLKRMLAEEGLFAAERKQPLPLLPRTIGFVTSPTGAALRDFVSILRRRGWGGRLVVLPVKVQGREAAKEIAAMIDRSGKMGTFDLLVVGRGGGSLEDLWCFNEEMVARAVAACPVPVISAVGHEIDLTLCDLASDQRVETPSAAAELISSGFLVCMDRVQRASERLLQSVERRLEEWKHALAILWRRLDSMSPLGRIENAHIRLDELSVRMGAAFSAGAADKYDLLRDLAVRLSAVSPRGVVRLLEERERALGQRLYLAVAVRLRESSAHVQQIGLRLHGSSPREVLLRGFVIVRDAEGNVVPRSAGLKAGAALINQFSDGSIEVRVNKVR